MKKFCNANVYVEGEGIKRTDLYFDEKIVCIGKSCGENCGKACGEKPAEAAAAEEIAVPEGAVVLPAFIDTHVHGAGGSDAMDGTEEALFTVAKTLAADGTATFLATTMTQSPENIKKALSAVKTYREKNCDEGAYIYGVHLEGPFIAEKFKGAQPLEYVAAPSVEVFREYQEASGNCIRTVTLAPEKDGAEELIKELKETGVNASVGHTSAKFADIENAVKAGAVGITHTYNAQSPLHHRDIGTVGAALLLDELQTEIIADTIHVSVPAIKLLVKNKPKEKITLITDAMRAKGMPDGESELGGQKVFVKNGEARLADGTLAGSVLKMNVAVKNMTEKVGVPFTEAVDFATKNPARMMGLSETKGSIKVGKDADFVILDKDFNVLKTIRAGKVIYER